MNKEKEKRVFLTDEQYKSLLIKFDVQSKQPERQITTYYNAKDINLKDIDLRFMRAQGYSKIWMKLGKMHAVCRPEYEVIMEPKYALNAIEIFNHLYDVKTKWFRERIKIENQPYIICIDKSINYYAIFEVEISDEKIGKEQGEKLLIAYLQELGLEETPENIQDEKCNDYISNWSKMDFPKNEEQWLLHDRNDK